MYLRSDHNMHSFYCCSFVLLLLPIALLSEMAMWPSMVVSHDSLAHPKFRGRFRCKTPGDPPPSCHGGVPLTAPCSQTSFFSLLRLLFFPLRVIHLTRKEREKCLTARLTLRPPPRARPAFTLLLPRATTLWSPVSVSTLFFLPCSFRHDSMGFSSLPPRDPNAACFFSLCFQ